MCWCRRHQQLDSRAVLIVQEDTGVSVLKWCCKGVFQDSQNQAMRVARGRSVATNWKSSTVSGIWGGVLIIFAVLRRVIDQYVAEAASVHLCHYYSLGVRLCELTNACKAQSPPALVELLWDMHTDMRYVVWAPGLSLGDTFCLDTGFEQWDAISPTFVFQFIHGLRQTWCHAQIQIFGYTCCGIHVWVYRHDGVHMRVNNQWRLVEGCLKIVGWGRSMMLFL